MQTCVFLWPCQEGLEHRSSASSVKPAIHAAMDALEALEQAEQTIGSPASKRPTKGGAVAVATKRRRCGLAFAPPASSDSFGGSASDLQMVTSSSGSRSGAVVVADEVASAGKRAPCLGCTRKIGDPGFWEQGEPLQWGVGDNKGAWCKDCHTCWRTMFSHTSSLALFPVWLSDRDHAVQFWQCLIAYLSLVLENHSKVTKAMVERRCETLRWVFAFLGLPFSPMSIETFSVGKGPVDLSNLTQLVDEEGMPRLGVVRPALRDVKMHDSSSRFQLPAPKEGCRWPSSLILQTGIEGEKEFLSKFVSGGGTWSSGSAQSASATSQAPTTLGKKLNGEVMLTKQWLEASFGTSSWTSLAKEGSFTPKVAIFSASKWDSIGGNKKVETVCSEFEQGLSAGKSFVRLWRVYQRHKKHEQFMACSESCEKFCAFLGDQEVQVHSTLELVRYKLDFHSSVVESQCLAQPVETLLQSSIVLLTSASRGGTSSEDGQALDAEVWVRDLIAHAAGLHFMRFSVEDFDEKREALAEDVTAIGQAVRSASSEFGQFADELSQLAYLLSLAKPGSDVKAASIRSSLELVSSPRMIRFTEFFKGPCGAHLQEIAGTLLQKQVGDELGINKIEGGLCVLTSKVMLNVVAGEDGSHMVQNAARAMDMTAVHAMYESLTLVVEGLGLFSSQANLHDQTSAVQAWAKQFKEVGACVAEVQLLEWARRLQGPFDKLCESSSGLDAMASLSPEITQAFDEQKRILQSELAAAIVEPIQTIATSDDWQDLLACIDNALKSKVFGVFEGEVTSDMNKCRESVVAAQNVATSLLSCVNAIQELRGVFYPATWKSCIDEWQANRMGGNLAPTFLDVVLRVRDRVAKWGHVLELQVAAFEAKGVVLKGVGRDSEEVVVGDALASLSRLGSCPIVRISRDSLACLQQGVFASLVDTLKLPVLRLDKLASLEKDDSSKAADLCSKLVDCLALDGDLSSFRKSLVDKEGQHSQTRAAALLEILKGIMVDDEDDKQVEDDPTLASLLEGEVVEGDRPLRSAVFDMLTLYMVLHEIALGISFVKSMALTSACLHNHKLKPEVEAAMERLGEDLGYVQDMIKDDRFQVIASAPAKWRFSIEQASLWSSSACFVFGRLKRHTIGIVVDNTFNVAEKLSKLTPAFLHVVTDKVYHPKLAKKQLLNFTGKDKLSEECVMLCGAMAHCASTHEDWELKPPLKEDIEYAEKLQFCDSAFKSAKQALVLITAVAILDKKSSDDTQKEARDFLERKRSVLPLSLLQLLEAFGKMATTTTKVSATKEKSPKTKKDS